MCGVMENVVEPVLELALVDQADLELTEIHLPLPPECVIKGVCYHCLDLSLIFKDIITVHI